MWVSLTGRKKEQHREKRPTILESPRHGLCHALHGFVSHRCVLPPVHTSWCGSPLLAAPSADAGRVFVGIATVCVRLLLEQLTIVVTQMSCQIHVGCIGSAVVNRHGLSSTKSHSYLCPSESPHKHIALVSEVSFVVERHLDLTLRSNILFQPKIVFVLNKK